MYKAITSKSHLSILTALILGASLAAGPAFAEKCKDNSRGCVLAGKTEGVRVELPEPLEISAPSAPLVGSTLIRE